jgi:NADH:ubiquinone oxidoreductase subunit 2 (subunit N)
MSAAAAVAIFLAVFAYIEMAVGTGYYMFLITKSTAETSDKEKKQLKKYSIAAGVLFPITIAILIAGRLAERK